MCSSDLTARAPKEAAHSEMSSLPHTTYTGAGAAAPITLSAQVRARDSRSASPSADARRPFATANDFTGTITASNTVTSLRRLSVR